MSRVGKKPVALPKGVDVQINDDVVEVKGAKGKLSLKLHPAIEVKMEDGQLQLAPKNEDSQNWAMCGTMRSLVHNMVCGVTEGFTKKLLLNGVGYRAQAEGDKLTLNLGFSNPVEFKVPQGITVNVPAATEIIVQGVDKQLVGEVAAKIRAFRPPEPYKGKGVRYEDEHVVLKEGKKK